MSSGLKAFLIFALVFLAFLITIVYAAQVGKETQHIANIECIKTGGTYGPISDLDRRLVCNK